jgi:hypothetical protein
MERNEKSRVIIEGVGDCHAELVEALQSPANKPVNRRLPTFEKKRPANVR